MLFYAINTEAALKNPEDPKSRISLGFTEGELDVSGEFGGVTVDGENTGLTSSDLQRIFGGYYTSIIARAEAVVAEHGGEHPVREEIDAAAKDPVKFNSMLRGLGAAEAGGLANAILSKDRDVSPEVVVAAANHKYGSVRASAADRRVRLPSELIIKMVEDPDINVRSVAARRNDLPPDLIVKLAGDPDVSVRSAIATQDYLPKDLIVKLAGDPSYRVRAAIVVRKDIPPELYFKFAEDPDDEVRSRTVSYAPPELYFKFAEDPADDVRLGIAVKPVLPLDLIVKLAGDPSARVRAAIAWKDNLPPDLIVKLAGDSDSGVRANIAYRKKGSLPTDLIVKLAGDADDRVRRIISRRTDLPPGLVVKLSESRRLAYRILREIKSTARI